MKAMDPVCGMQVDMNKTALRSEYQGRSYYFCTVSCRNAFDAHPERYVIRGLARWENNQESHHGLS